MKIISLALLLASLLLHAGCQSKSDKQSDGTSACPKCGELVFGHLVSWEGQDLEGTPAFGAFLEGACRKCGIDLVTEHADIRTNVAWRMAEPE